ncbi:hypothetical protein [Aquipuribacter hungaricus]|uniref:Winged helix DNA-binding domain-containing protein n=1 Tax=Aquipuribacter hungaricus TaxID=545624 RepID=A0ABV7WMU9_9MICO
MLIAVSGGRVTRLPPRTPPRGNLETSVALTVAHALPLRPRAQQVALHHLLGWGTQAPGPMADTAARWGITRGRVNDLLLEVRRFATTVPTPPAVEATGQALSGGGIRYAHEPARVLVRRGVLEQELHPGVLARALSLYGVSSPPFVVGRHGPVLVPVGSRVVLEEQRRHVVRRLERDIAVPVLSAAVADVLLGGRLLEGLLPAPRSPGTGRGVRRTVSREGTAWLWRSWDVDSREPGTAVRLVQRLLSVHRNSPTALRALLVAALQQQPGSIRAPSVDVAPARVLEAWLQHVSTQEPQLTKTRQGWRWARPLHPVDAVVLDVVRGTAGEPVPAAVLLDQLVASGVSHGGAVQQLLRTPVLSRLSRGLYVERTPGG